VSVLPNRSFDADAEVLQCASRARLRSPVSSDVRPQNEKSLGTCADSH
jgi:hypothetical protein